MGLELSIISFPAPEEGDPSLILKAPDLPDAYNVGESGAVTWNAEPGHGVLHSCTIDLMKLPLGTRTITIEVLE